MRKETKDKIITLTLGGIASVTAVVFGPGIVKRAFADKDDPVISPVEAGIVEFVSGESSEGSIGSAPGFSSFGTLGGEPEQEQTRVTIPLDETEPFSKTIGANTVEVVFEAPQLFVSTEDGQIVPTVQSRVITKNVDGTPTTQTVFIDQFGNTFASEFELLNAAVKLSDEINAQLQSGTALSTIEALIAGQPINTTNFITERPTFFPQAPIDSEFQRRAQAIGATLTADNPGASSASQIANFSRLAAVGTDLSQIDIFGVQNPDFLGQIKTGQGPLTDSQKVLLDQVRLSIDPRNMTSSDFEEIRRNQARAAAERQALANEVIQLRNAGLTVEIARQILNDMGFAVRGDVTLELFATLNDRFGGVTAAIPLINAAKQFDVKKNLEAAIGTVAGAGTRSQTISGLKNFLSQTGRRDLNNLAPQELFRLSQSFPNVTTFGGSNQPAVQALKLLLPEVT